MNSVLFSGYYGQRNTGDDAFCVVAAWGAKQYWHLDRIRFLSTTIPELTVPAKCVLPIKQHFKGETLLLSFLSSVQSQHVIYFGGSLFHKKLRNLTSRFYYGQSNFFRNKKVSAVGVSLGPFLNKEDQMYIRSVLNNMAFLSVRDEASYQASVEMRLNVPVIKSFDPAVLLPFAYGEDILKQEDQKKVRPVLGISLCYFERFVGGDVSVEQKREYVILRALRNLVKSHEVLLRFFIFNDHPDFSDAKLTHRIIDSLDGYPFVDVVPYSCNPGQTFRAVKGCDAFFGIRLHSAIFAYTASIPFALVEYHKKCEDFLHEIGYKDEFRVPYDGGSELELLEVLRLLISQGSSKSFYSMPLQRAQRLALSNFLEAPWSQE